MVPFESLGAVSVSLSIVTTAVSLNVNAASKNSVTLKTGLGVDQGH